MSNPIFGDVLFLHKQDDMVERAWAIGKRIQPQFGPTWGWLFCLVVAILFSMMGAESARAHAQLIRSNPLDKAELKTAPTHIELWFNELLEDGFNSVEVILASDLAAKNPTNFVRGQPKVDSSDPTHLRAGLSELKPGRYIIRYRVLSRDGHSAPGQIVMRVLDVKP